MHWQRASGIVLCGAGSLLLAAYALPTVFGWGMARLAVAEFRAQSSSHRGWDSARIRAYQRSLGIAMEPQAVLRVPKEHLEVPVFEGTSELVLNRGVGHIAGTALPGQAGNVALAGHRDGFFRGLKDVGAGDVIELQRHGRAGWTVDRYRVERTEVVLPSNTSVLQPTSEDELTLVTCFPFHYVGAAPERFVVQARLLPQTQAAAGGI